MTSQLPYVVVLGLVAITAGIATVACDRPAPSPRAAPPAPASPPAAFVSSPARSTPLAPAAPLAPFPAPSTESDAPVVRVAAAPRPGAFANVDPDDDLVVGPPEEVDDCEGRLERAGVTFHAAKLPVRTDKRSRITCGAPQVVTYLRGPGRIAYSSPPLLTCKMALALAWFETLAQVEAKEHLHSRIARIDHLGTYNCRMMAAYPGWVSEHSYANAIDISRFVLQNGRAIDVLGDFDVGADAPKKPAGAFLRVLSRRANDEDVFSHVLTPFYDHHHKNHFHLDLSRYRTDGTRPQT